MKSGGASFGRSRYQDGLPTIELWGVCKREPSSNTGKPVAKRGEAARARRALKRAARKYGGTFKSYLRYVAGRAR